MQGRMTSGEQGGGEDEEKAALRHHIHQLQQAAARDQLTAQQASASQATDEERLEAALHQERLQARIRQLEVMCSSSELPCLLGPWSHSCIVSGQCSYTILQACERHKHDKTQCENHAHHSMLFDLHLKDIVVSLEKMAHRPFLFTLRELNC